MVANGFEGVPWMVGGGAKHSANVGRVLAYAATSGSEGVVAPGDCKVSASAPTADNKVHVATGALAIRNRYGAVQSETYITRAPQVSDLTVGSTGSTKRSDLVIVRIKDPQYGAQAPASLADGPYAFPEIVPGVPEGTTNAKQISALLNEPVYALARIDIPANNTSGVITQGMIKELRELVLPRSRREMFSSNAGQPGGTLVATDFVDWPTVYFDVKVPEWATFANMRVDMDGVVQTAPQADLRMRAHIGTSQVSGELGVDKDTWTDGIRHGFMLTCGGPLNASDRGNVVRLKVMAKVVAPTTHLGRYATDWMTHVGYDIQFDERIV